jgi:hypothetical protein
VVLRQGLDAIARVGAQRQDQLGARQGLVEGEAGRVRGVEEHPAAAWAGACQASRTSRTRARRAGGPRLEEGVPFQPRGVAPGRMGQREGRGRMVAPVAHPVRHAPAPEVPRLGRAAHKEGEAHGRHGRQRLAAPGLGADRGGRDVPARRVVAREAEAHGDDGHAGLVVELVLADPHPLAQAHARRVHEGLAAQVGAHARRLGRDEKPRAGAEPHHGARLVGGRGGAEARRAEAAGGHALPDGRGARGLRHLAREGRFRLQGPPPRPYRDREPPREGPCTASGTSSRPTRS